MWLKSPADDEDFLQVLIEMSDTVHSRAVGVLVATLRSEDESFVNWRRLNRKAQFTQSFAITQNSRCKRAGRRTRPSCLAGRTLDVRRILRNEGFLEGS